MRCSRRSARARRRRPVKVALHAAADVQQHHAPARRRSSASASAPTRDGKITAIGHESWSGDLPGGKPEAAVQPDAAALCRRQPHDRDAAGGARSARRQCHARARRGAGHDGAGDRHGRDGREARASIRSSSAIRQRHAGRSREKPGAAVLAAPARRVPAHSAPSASAGASATPQPGSVRDGRWLVGMGVAAAFRNNLLMKSAARVRLDNRGIVTVETDMTDIGTGSYTIIAQTAAEMMGVPLDKVVVRLGDSAFPVSSGSGGQWGGNSSTAGVYAACVKLREAVAQKLGFNCRRGGVRRRRRCASGNRSVPLAEAAGDGGLVAEDAIEYGDLDKKYQQSTFGAHFVEVGVDAATGEIRVRRMLAVCAAGRILNPKIGAQPGDRRDDDGRRRGADGGARGRQARRLLRQPRPRRLRGAGACRHSAPGGDLPRRDRSDVVADEGQGRRRARHLRRRRRPSPTRSTTPPACACATIRSRSTSCWTGCRTWHER